MDLYDQSVATYRSRLDTLTGLLTKAEAHTSNDTLLDARLAGDMHPLATQIRFVTNIPGEALDRLGVCEFTSSDEALTNFARAKELVSQTSEMLDSISPGDLPSPDARIEFAIGDGAYQFEMRAEEYVREFSLPNLYFHLSIAYAVLRMKGLEVGKSDFIPHMARYFTRPPG
ncbi:DUF1993 domain-containing protein [Erythrobacter sp. W53]|uniref:DUF1993 domain-containing protein n=1 Tax=Erythrobacter sp. W53 TaxID=3425947 RepID=UPI003D768BF7